MTSIGRLVAVTVAAIAIGLAIYTIGTVLGHAYQAYMAPITNFLRVVA